MVIKLEREISLGRMAGPFQSPPFSNFHASHVGLVPKQDPGKVRLVHDLSLPRGDSTNFYTSKDFTTVQYETQDRVVELGQGSLIAMEDIQDAFRLIPIRSQDYPLVGTMWKNMFYYDKILPMGSSVS